MPVFWEEHGSKGDKRECKRRGRSGEEERGSGKMKRRERFEKKGDSTGGRKNCWERAGQLIFYKPGLERSWNEEWEKDSWEPATGRRREKEWDSWITALWSETSVGFAAEGEKQRVVGEKRLHSAFSVCLDTFQSDLPSTSGLLFCLSALVCSWRTLLVVLHALTFISWGLKWFSSAFEHVRNLVICCEMTTGNTI